MVNELEYYLTSGVEVLILKLIAASKHVFPDNTSKVLLTAFTEYHEEEEAALSKQLIIPSQAR